MTIDDPDVRGELHWTVERAGIGDGIVVWFDADLAAGVSFSNAPGTPETIYGSLFFPWTHPVPLAPGETVCVQLALQSTNVITGQIESTPLFFYDTLASETNRGLLLNIGGTAPPPFGTQRPANYLLSRIDDGRFAAGRAGNIAPDASFLYDGLTFTNRIVTGEYAGYGAFVDNAVGVYDAGPPIIGSAPLSISSTSMYK